MTRRTGARLPLFVLWVAVAVSVAACATKPPVAAAPAREPGWGQGTFTASDGAQLPLTSWLPDGRPDAVIIGVHGFSDYHRAFALPAPFWASRSVAVYSYDQRGFGAAPLRGQWPGTDRLVADLRDLIALVQARHPGVPLYLLGDSMGAAVVLVTLQRNTHLDVAGAILNAPAVWGGDTFNPFYRLTLWLAAHTVPGWEVTGRGLQVTVTDNRELLRELSRDPLMLRGTRIDALYGLVQLMDAGLAAAPAVSGRVLVLYGLKDEVIPRASVCQLLAALPAHRSAHFYPEGYHLLLRDLQAERPWQDVVAWLDGQPAPAPDRCPP